MADYIFPGQNNVGFPQTLLMNKAVPAIANRIFPTYADALEFISSATAIKGLILRVVEDDEENKNGVYFVRKNGDGLKLSKMAEGTLDISGRMIDVVLANDDNFYDKNDCTETVDGWVPNEGAVAIVDESVTEAGKYLVLELGNDVVYINSKDLVDMEDYYKKEEVEELIADEDSSIRIELERIELDASIQRDDFDELERQINAGLDFVINQ